MGELDPDITLPGIGPTEAGWPRSVSRESRYQRVRPIGSGGSATVWEAIDLASASRVALKVIPLRTTAEAGRARREAAALRIGQLEGVARLLDDFVEDDHHFIVMEYVEGVHFPGTPSRSWEDLRGPTLRLLEAVSRLHRIGVVHRDLKPANVLVDARGGVTVVDLGIAKGAAVDTTITAVGHVIGTPRYLSPEQARGEAADLRADLYAIGVMLYEALSGAPPVDESEGMRALLLAKGVGRVTPLAGRAPHTPPAVARVVDALLATWPADRPQSALEVVAALGGVDGPDRLPWLGARDGIEAACARLRRGLPCVVGGPTGSGRRRVVLEVVAVLEAEGRDVRHAAAGSRPLESLRPVLPEGWEEGAAIAAAEQALASLLAAGVVLVVGDPERLDRWTRTLLSRTAGAGAVLSISDRDGDVHTAPLDVEALRTLFHGPEALLHLRSDAAAALHGRTGGNPERVVRELDAWVASGMARWRDGRLTIDREGIERAGAGLVPARTVAPLVTLSEPLDHLLAWIALGGEVPSIRVLHEATGLPTWEIEAEVDELGALGAVRSLPDGRLQALARPEVANRWGDAALADAHARLARALLPGTPGRILHLAAAGDALALAEEALVAGRALVRTGAAARAVVLLGLGLGRLPEPAPSPLGEELHVELARAALVAGAPALLARAAADLRQHGDPVGVALAALLHAWADVEAGRLDEAVARIVGLAPFPDEEVDAYRQLIHVRAALARDPAEADALLTERDDTRPGSFLTLRRSEWLAHVRFNQGRFVEAAELHRAVAAAEQNPRRRVTALVNAAWATLVHPDPTPARALLLEAAGVAELLRIPEVEGFARLGLRKLAWRLEEPLEPDPELLDAARHVGTTRLVGELSLLDAVLGWRRGDHPEAARLAAEARRSFESTGSDRGRMLARALAAAAGAPEPELAGLVVAARDLGPPSLFFQVAALARAAGLALPGELLDAARAAAAIARPEREAVLAPAEAMGYLR